MSITQNRMMPADALAGNGALFTPVKMRWRPPGRWSTRFLTRTTRLTATGPAAGGRNRLMRSLRQTDAGTIPYA